MTANDPKCPQQYTHPKHSPDRCIFCEYGAAVREDERTRWTADQKIGMTTMYGYELGQRDERERIRTGVNEIMPRAWSCDADCWIDEALAVIDGGES